MTAEEHQKTELVVVPRETRTLAKRERAPLTFTVEQRQMILNTFCNGASPDEAMVLMEIAKAKRLNPLLGQVHFVKRWTQDRGEVWAAQTGIDGFRSIAEDTGLYDGQDEPEFHYVGDGEKRRLDFVKVRVYRKDVSRAFVGVAHFTEYAQRKRDGQLTRMWAEKPHIMIAKCAESLAMRKAFPQELGDLYTAEEMGRAQEEHERLEGQIAPSKPAERSGEVNWLEEIQAAGTEEALDAVGKQINTHVPKGKLRDSLKAAWKVRKEQIVGTGERQPGEDDA